MNINSKIYIAGHRGLVGSNILNYLTRNGYKNIITRTHSELDLNRQRDVEEFFEKERPEYVFLCAAKVGGILANSTYPARFIYDNLMISTNIIHSSYKYGVKKLLNLGSSCIYPKLAPQPLREEYLLSGYLEPTNEAYALAKIAAIKLCRYYNDQYKTNFISVMPTNLYGVGDNYNLETSHVLPAMIRKMHIAKLLEDNEFEAVVEDLRRNPIGFGLDEKLDLSNKDSIINVLSEIGIKSDYKDGVVKEVELVLWGSGEVYREFMYIEDMVEASVYLMKNIDANTMKKMSPDYFVNVGTGKDIKLKELAMLIKRIVGFKGKITYDHNKPDGTPRKLLDVSKLKALGWEARIDLEDGIKKVYDYYIKNVHHQ